MSDVPAVELVEQLRRANTGLRDVLAARDTQIGELQAMVHALGLQVAELQRRLGSGSDDSGTPSAGTVDPSVAGHRGHAERFSRRLVEDGFFEWRGTLV